MIKLVSLNIERSEHLDIVIPFLQTRNADVVCLQELCEVDIPVFAELLGTPALYVRAKKEFADGTSKVEGIGIFSRLPIPSTGVRYYHGSVDTVP